jgi:hypothetical protein
MDFQWRESLAVLNKRTLDDDDDECTDEMFWKVAKTLAGALTDQRQLTQNHGGSRIGRRPNLNRNHAAGHEQIFRDYFAENAVYDEKLFRRRFRMSKRLFLKIMGDVSAADDYFQQRNDALGIPGLSTIQKITAACRLLCYGVASDAVDEYIRIGESTAAECMKRFCFALVSVYGMEYRRLPTQADMDRWLEINAKRGFPGMFGSLDCTHWVWKNCPMAWHGQHQDKSGKRSIILEAIATQDLWIWHSYVGMPGSNNDINVVDRSPLVGDLLKGAASKASFEVNGKTYNGSYLLCDGIYPSWPIFIKTIAQPQGEKKKHFAKMQEAVRKDVERCFGVLKARFAIICNPCRLWSQEMMQTVWSACIILHNMIIEDERDQADIDQAYLLETFICDAHDQESPGLNFDDFCTAMLNAQNQAQHFVLRDDIVSHLWEIKGNA